MSVVPVQKVTSPCSLKHDKLGWTAGISAKVDDSVLGFRSNDAAEVENMRSLMSELGQLVEAEQVDRLVSLRVGPPSKRKGSANFNVLYAGCNPGFKSLEIDEVRTRAADLLRIEARLLRNDLTHIDSYLFSPPGSSKLICLVASDKDRCSPVINPIRKEGIVPESSGYTSLSKDGSALFRPIRRDTGKSPGFGRVTDFVYLEQENLQPIQSVGHLALVLYGLTEFGLEKQEGIDCILASLKTARAHVISAAEPEKQTARLRDVVFSEEDSSIDVGKLVRHG